MLRFFAVTTCLVSLVGCASVETGSPAKVASAVQPGAAVECDSREPPLGSNVKRRKCISYSSEEERARKVEEFKDSLQPAQLDPTGAKSVK